MIADSRITNRPSLTHLLISLVWLSL